MIVKGSYNITVEYQTMHKDYRAVLHGDNLITFLGASFFMNRWKDDKIPPISDIVIGDSDRSPQKTDEAIGNQLIILKPTIRVDLEQMALVMTCNVDPNRIIGACEIGVRNGDGTLLSHDAFPILTEEILGASTNISLEYQFALETAHTIPSWTPYSPNVYYTQVDTLVNGVYDKYGNGYSKAENIDAVDSAFKYYYSAFNHRVYIYNSGDPDDDKITIKE